MNAFLEFIKYRRVCTVGARLRTDVFKAEIEATISSVLTMALA